MRKQKINNQGRREIVKEVWVLTALAASGWGFSAIAQNEGDDSATLVRGGDTFKTFAHEPRAIQEMEPAFVKLHQELTEKSAKILYNSTKVDRYDASLADPKVRSA